MALFGWVWTVFGVWLAIHAARSRQGSATSYEDMLNNITDILDRTLRAARLCVCHTKPERVRDDFKVKMVLYTPSNGNVSSRSLKAYKRYREKLTEVAQVDCVELTIVCLTKEGIRRYYGCYLDRWGTDAQKEKHLNEACKEALVLWDELAYHADFNIQTGLSGNAHFTLLTADERDKLLPEHLIIGPGEAWIWIPHNPPSEKEDPSRCGVDDSLTRDEGEGLVQYRERRSKKALEDLDKARSAAKHARGGIDGLDCLAVRTEDRALIGRIWGWIDQCAQSVRASQRERKE
jgi:hypothetical protein